MPSNSTIIDECAEEKQKYIDEIQVDYAAFFPLFAFSLLLAAFLGYVSSYFVSILYFYKKKKEKFDQEVENDIKKNAIKDLHDSSSAPKKIRKLDTEMPAAEQTSTVPINPAAPETPPIQSVPKKK